MRQGLTSAMAGVNDARCGRSRVAAASGARGAVYRLADRRIGQMRVHADAFNPTAVWRIRNLEGYLERKLHRQWRCRGS